MKKSEIYRLAQLAILRDPLIKDDWKLEVLAELMSDEKVAKFAEDREEKEVKKNESV